MRYGIFAVLILFLFTMQLHAETGRQPIGLIKVASGDAAIIRTGQRLAAKAGEQLFQMDVLSTGSKGSLGIILRDDTTLSLGPSSEVHLQQFTFKPAEQKLGMVVRFTRGMISYMSGKIAKLAPGSVRLETPTATLGVRGYQPGRVDRTMKHLRALLVLSATCLAIAGCSGPKSHVVLLPDNGNPSGEVLVTNTHGSQVLNRSWQTTEVGEGAPSTPVVQDKTVIQEMVGPP